MSFGPLRSLVLGINQAVLGVTATVTQPGGTPITTGADGNPLKVIWVVEPVNDDQPYGSDFRRGVPRQVMAIAKVDVPELSRGAVIVAPEIAGEVDKTWTVDGFDRVLADQWRAIVKLSN